MAKTVSLEEMNTWITTPCVSASKLILKNVDKTKQFTAKEVLSFEGITVYDLMYAERYYTGFVDVNFRSASVAVLKTFSYMFPHPIVDNLEDIKTYDVEQLKQKQKEARVMYKLFQHHKLSQIIAGIIWCCETKITRNEFFNIVGVHYEFFKDDQTKIDELTQIILGYL